MKKIVFVSYYTRATPYEKVMNTFLLPSLKKFNLTYDIEVVEDLGSWQLNTSYKSTHLLKMLQKHKCPVVFLDADAEVKKYPELFWEIPDEYDIGVHYLDWFFMWRKQPGNSKRHLLSGTMYLNYNPKVISLVNEFIEEIKKNSNTMEQRSMEVVVERRKDVNVYKLPYSYITFPMQDNSIPKHMISEKDIFILHHQASRKLRNRRNWKK